MSISDSKDTQITKTAGGTIAPVEAEVVTQPIATPKPKEREIGHVSDYIKPSLIRYPMYTYQTGKQWFLSKTEKICVDAYLKTFNLNETMRALNAIRVAHGSSKTYDVRAIKRWLQRPHVADYIGKKLEAQGLVNWNKEEDWEAWGIKVQNGNLPATQVQVTVWKERGKAKGWYKESGPAVQNNMQINFVQSDGKA